MCFLRRGEGMEAGRAEWRFWQQGRRFWQQGRRFWRQRRRFWRQGRRVFEAPKKRQAGQTGVSGGKEGAGVLFHRIPPTRPLLPQTPDPHAHPPHLMRFLRRTEGMEAGRKAWFLIRSCALAAPAFLISPIFLPSQLMRFLRRTEGMEAARKACEFYTPYPPNPSQPLPTPPHHQLMRFLRRTEGMEAARKAFLAARKARECSFHVYVASAYMELCHNKESKVSTGGSEGKVKGCDWHGEQGRRGSARSTLNERPNGECLFHVYVASACLELCQNQESKVREGGTEGKEGNGAKEDIGGKGGVSGSKEGTGVLVPCVRGVCLYGAVLCRNKESKVCSLLESSQRRPGHAGAAARCSGVPIPATALRTHGQCSPLWWHGCCDALSSLLLLSHLNPQRRPGHAGVAARRSDLWEELVECEQLFGDLTSLIKLQPLPIPSRPFLSILPVSLSPSLQAQEGRRKALASVASPGGAAEPEVEVWREQQDLVDRFSYCGLLPCDPSALPPNLEAGSAGPEAIQARQRSGEAQVRETGQAAAERAEREAKEQEARNGTSAAAPAAAASTAAGAAAAAAQIAAVAGVQRDSVSKAGVKAERQESPLPPPLPPSVSLSQGIGPAPPAVSSLSAALAAAAAVLMPREGAAGAGGAAGAATEAGGKGNVKEEATSRRVKEEAEGGERPGAAVGADGSTAGAGGAKEGGEKGGVEKGEQQKEGLAGAAGVKTHQFVASAAVEWKPGE
ncbi:unnamed protein product [Closterium sp. NIES-54]